jgi:tRNA modification GTPase
LALPFAAEHSYTGEEAVELSMHGSRASINFVMEACLAAGARIAEAGEFTQRAFLNGRIDLSQAEGVRESCEAQTEAQLRLACQVREGSIWRAVSGYRERLLKMLGSVEASIDFCEEIGEFDRVSSAREVSSILRSLDQLLNNAEAGRILREGLRVAIVGPPNAGKSSLMNALLGVERSIVTEVPGTTRDYIEETADFKGVPVVLIDTAGLRETSDLVETLGVQKSRALAAHADEIWFVYDVSQGWGEELDFLSRAFNRPVRLLANKADLGGSGPGQRVSTLTREGLDILVSDIAARAEAQPDVPLINRRHEPILLAARDTLEALELSLEGDAPDDLLSVLITQSTMQLGEITGETSSPDMVEAIFHDFCVGK